MEDNIERPRFIKVPLLKSTHNYSVGTQNHCAGKAGWRVLMEKHFVHPMFIKVPPLKQHT